MSSRNSERLTAEEIRHRGPLSHLQAMQSRTMRQKMDYVLDRYGRTDLLSEDKDADEDALIAAIDARREEERAA